MDLGSILSDFSLSVVHQMWIHVEAEKDDLIYILGAVT